mmetsp:Transcript_124872/g.361216  ORF Transcript_124872/g.361216 Transcript_124872/m.361216 type:complete len:203 (+) Transcript_124872:623-1231(+)
MLVQRIDHLRRPLARCEEDRRLTVPIAMIQVAVPAGVISQAIDVARLCEVVRGCLLVEVDVVQVHAIVLDEKPRHLRGAPGVLHRVERQRLAKVVPRLRIKLALLEGPAQRLHALLAHGPAGRIEPSQQRDGRAGAVADVYDIAGAQLPRLVDQLLLLDGDAEATPDGHLQLLQPPTPGSFEGALLAAYADDAQRHGAQAPK